MLLAFRSLKHNYLPELNERIVPAARLFEVLEMRSTEFYELPFSDTNGAYIKDDYGREYVILKRGLRQLLFHETLALETTHACLHEYAPYLLRKQRLEAEVLGLLCLMPLADLPRLNRIKSNLDPENYELLKKRNKANEIWRL